MNSNSFWKGVLAGAGITLALAAAYLFLLNPTLAQALRPGGLTLSESVQLLGKFESVKRAMDHLYWEDIDEATHQEMMDAAVHAYASGVGDKYTSYFTPEEFDEFLESISGSYCGIGVTVFLNEEAGLVEIKKVASAGACAGTAVRPGDLIVTVDGQSMQGLSLDEVVTYVRGEEGSSVTIRFRRPDGEEYVQTLVRSFFSSDTVELDFREVGGRRVAYIYISEFDEVTTEQFETALIGIRMQGAEGIILDVRDNPGGLLDTVTAMLDMLLPEGIITWTEDKYGHREEFKSDASHMELPMVLICNDQSASASEIFAGALKDYGAAVLVGETTFGKGIVQRTVSFADGSALKTTVSRYFTPKGVCIHGIGVEPDYPVSLPEGIYFSEDLPEEDDTQYQKALSVLLDLLR